MAKPNFPSPHNIETIPGTEGWERMYPHYYQFAKEDSKRKEYEKEMFWFNDGLHYPEPMYPFDIIWDESWFLALSQFCERIFKVPPSRGVDHRIINGNIYISPVGVLDPKEIEGRVPDFMERAGHYFGNWDKLEENWKKKMTDIIEELETLKIPDLPQTEELSVVTEGIGLSSGYELLKSYDKLIDLGIRCWQYHFEFLVLGYAAYVQFVDFCTTAFPDIPLQKITQMVGGIDVIMYQPDEELKKLAKLAIELGLGDAIKVDKDVEDTLTVLAKSEKGAEWTKAWDKAKHPWFNISCGTGWYHHDGSWNDDLNVPISAIRTYISKLQEGKSIDRPLKEVAATREKLVTEYRALLETDEDRQTFDQLWGTSKLVFPYVENHLFYVEHWFHTVFWNKMREVSRIMVNQGLLEDVEDIWYLQRGEIKTHLWDMVTSWATGIEAHGCSHLPKEIAWRKGVYEKFKEWDRPEALGTPPEVITEPFTIVLWGVTNESMAAWSKIREIGDPDKVTEMTGFAASPGVVEGIARVCRSVKDIGELKEGEILVSPTTSPSWAPVFQKIKAVVTDVGGIMSHAAIVCREYGMPAIVGTGKATSIIKTGMRIKVDDNTGKIDLMR